MKNGSKTTVLKRLFLVAGYNPNGIIDEALAYYVRQLKRFGDVILCMDSDIDDSELEKVQKYCLHVMAKRHGEYDFGSYKRAYKWACDNLTLRDYTCLYLVNDSVYGPVFDMGEILGKLESTGTHASGIVISKHRTHSFLESWFVKLTKKIFLSEWFAKFLDSVTQEPTKNQVTLKYEHGLTNLILENECTARGVYLVHGRHTYNYPKSLVLHGCPFFKKVCFTRHCGALGAQVKYILDHTNVITRTAIMDSVNRLYGAEYVKNFLTSNPFKILGR